MRAGQRVGGGRFLLDRLLGCGGMGEVWLAQDERLSEPVALKFLPPEIRGDARALDELRRETARSHRLTHPHIVRLHDFHQLEAEPAFIAMEFVDGPTLAVLGLRPEAHVLSWEFLKPLVRQLCDALQYAHGEKVIHRDLKPANLMVDGNGRLKLADFGIATADSDSTGQLSQHPATSGTLPYMSPQQLAGWRSQPADDIYALGATLYELLTSRPPFYAGDIIHQVLHEAPEPLNERLAALGIQNPVPGDVAAMILACLAKDPAHRPPSAAAVAALIGLEMGDKPALETLTEEMFSPPPLTNSARRVLDRRSAFGRAGKMRLWIGGFVLGVLMLGSGWFWRAHRIEARPPSPPNGKEPWSNSLGMKLVPVAGTRVLFSIWDTRVRDYAVFAKTDAHQGGGFWNSPGFVQTPEDPVVRVTWQHAKAFCRWLTEREKAAGWIGPDQSYRLPTDVEWSVAVGLVDEQGSTPQYKHQRVKNVYPWGGEWPPPKSAGNYRGSETVTANGPSEHKTIQGYRDRYAKTSPVGSFRMNRFGLYDMGGNVWQWCEDWFDSQQIYRVLRGGSWDDDEAENLLSSSRAYAPPNTRNGSSGFRCVLVTETVR